MKAFPRADMKFNSLVSDELGMDLRDYFAAKAINQLLMIFWLVVGHLLMKIYRNLLHNIVMK